jgi:hypothetical protein
MSKNKKMIKARKAKNDEFYTQLPDIEKEMKSYKRHFEGKVVYCNCDDPTSSNFWQYFSLNFRFLGLKKLVSTHFHTSEPTYKLEMTKPGEVIKTELTQNGDFRSPESIKILQEADIVVTNPPFSLFREYIAQLVEYGKKFIVLGNQNAISYKEIFKLIRANKLWLGTRSNVTMTFRVPDHYVSGEDNLVKVPAISWFTNLEHVKRNKELLLFKKYSGNANEYPEFDNYKAINIDKVKYIPEDYWEPMGVPITFLGSYNPEQFEILDCNDYRVDPDHTPYKEHGLIKDKDGTINGKAKYVRILIQRVKTDIDTDKADKLDEEQNGN